MIRPTFISFARVVFSRIRCVAQHGIKRKAGYFTAGGVTLGLSLFGGANKSQDRTLNSMAPSKFAKTEQIIREADVFYNAYMIDNAYELLAEHRQSTDPELLWRIARVTYEKGRITQNKEEKITFYKDALEIVDGALGTENGGRCFGAHKWYAIILSGVSEQEGTKAQITKSYEVKAHLERALEIEPLDATTWHILGFWHFSFADLSTLQRYAAKAIFGTPPSSTYEEALSHFEKAEAISPGFYSTNTYWMGMAYERLGKKKEALKCFKDAFMAPVVSVADGEIHSKAHDHLRKSYGINVEQLLAK